MAKKHIGKRFDPVLVEHFDKLCERFPTPDVCLTFMLERADQPQSERADPPQSERAEPSQLVSSLADILTLVQCSDDEREMIEQAASQSVIPWKKITRTGIVAEWKLRTTYAKK